MILDLDPVIFQLGPFALRWYGLFMAISIAAGFYYFLRDAKRLGHDPDFIYNAALIALIAGIAGARLVYVATNWDLYATFPWAILRIDHGGLSFHGGIIGGVLAGGLYVAMKGKDYRELADLAVPGIGIGIALVRIGNLINAEVLGRYSEILAFRHPAQIYGSLVGVAVLIIHNAIARRRPPAGYLFWSFVLYYSLIRGIFEETFRENPLYAWGYINDQWGIGLFTLTQLITVPLAALALWQRKRA